MAPVTPTTPILPTPSLFLVNVPFISYYTGCELHLLCSSDIALATATKLGLILAVAKGNLSAVVFSSNYFYSDQEELLHDCSAHLNQLICFRCYCMRHGVGKGGMGYGMCICQKF